LLGALAAQRANVELIVLQGWFPAPLRDALPEIPVSVAPIGRRDPRVVPWLAALVRERRLDLLQSFLWYADVIGSLAALGGGVPLVASERGDRAPTFYSRKRRIADRIAVLPIAKGFVANSHASVETLLRIGVRPGRIALIPNGVELPAPLPKPALPWPGGFIACAVGSLSPHKGIDTFVRAIASCPATAQVRGLIVGGGPQRAALEALVADLGASDRIVFMGQRFPATAYIQAADVGVSAAVRDEACSNSLLEFMACGKPVLATAVAGNRELVGPGQAGALYPPGDWRSLAKLLEALARDSHLQTVTGMAAKDRVAEHYSMQTAAAAYQQLWARVCAGEPRFAPSLPGKALTVPEPTSSVRRVIED
jgi:glycosyltransferase involved in cell wall biosynthesis